MPCHGQVDGWLFNPFFKGMAQMVQQVAYPRNAGAMLASDRANCHVRMDRLAAHPGRDSILPQKDAKPAPSGLFVHLL